MSKPAAIFALLLTCAAHFAAARAQGTAFTYQGRLNNNDAPANGSYDIAFSLFATNTSGVAIVVPVTNTAVGVASGLFTTTVDFGNAFNGTSNWLQIAVSTNGANNFTTLSPRQQLTPVPYAIYAGSANASNLVGTVPAMQLPGTVLTNGASGVNLSGSFNFTGGSSTNLSAWQLNGNTGTTNGNYLGTTDSQPLEIRVGGGRAGLISPSNGLPNVIFGTAQNVISNTTAGASILGGSGNTVQAGSSYSVIGGGSGNTIQSVDDHSVIAGGVNNSIQAGANLSVLGGGQGNIIGSSAFASFLGSGIDNVIFGGASYAVIGGGNANSIQANAYQSVIAGGNNNTIESGSVGSFIGSGIDNNIQANDIYSVLVGGEENYIWTGAAFSFLGGGQFNNLQAGAIHSVLGGGTYNMIQAGNSFLGSGQQNTISNNATYSVLVGGYQNSVVGIYATVPGGASNNAGGQFSFAAGANANATNNGAFVWSDAEGSTFSSINTNSFNVRANGGVRFVTGGTGVTVDGQPLVTAAAGGVALGNLTLNGTLTLPLPSVINGAFTFFGSPATNHILISDGNLNYFAGLLDGNTNLSGMNNTGVGAFGLGGITTGSGNTGAGAFALEGITSGSDNTGVGSQALGGTTTGSANTASGYQALSSDPAGGNNVAIGCQALQNSANGYDLVAVGYQALQNDNAGGLFSSANTGVGYQALQADNTGFFNTAVGFGAITRNTGGSENTALGVNALSGSTGGNNNTAVGFGALGSSTGNNNIGIGNGVGQNLTTGNNNIYIGSPGTNGDSGITRIGTEGVQSQAFVAGVLTCDGLVAGPVITSLVQDSGPVFCALVNSSGGVFTSGSIICNNIINGGNDTCATLTCSNIVNTGNDSCATLTITGGSDLAEPFQISGVSGEIPKGSVMVIDEEHPGQLKLSGRAYDSRVAGVLSGANGINPGLQMRQRGVLDGSDNLALSGRVYVQADTSNGAIKPGDLLTTSSTPGHAMKVTDHMKAQGAILGKAMTGLSEGKGMVLVLVTLQ